MRIGLSYSRCVRDIVDGTVDINDVLVVIARTDFDPHDDDQWEGIWQGYHDHLGLSAPEWASYSNEDEDRFRSVSIELWDTGRLHQPRKFGYHVRRMPYYWLEATLPSDELEKFPAVKTAWDNFQVVAGLANIKMNKDA